MLKEGYSKKELIGAMINCSPELESRKPYHSFD
jgi:hypothetical protein